MFRILFLEGKSRNEIKKHTNAIETSASMMSVINWFSEFQRGRTNVGVTKVHN